MAFTFIKEAGVDIGDSLYDAEGAKLVPEIKKKAEETLGAFVAGLLVEHVGQRSRREP